MFDWRAIGAAAATSCAKSGPMISSAPSWIALCAAACAPVRRALGVFRHERDRRIVEIEQRKLGRLLQRLGDGGRVARAGERQEQSDLHRAGRAGHARRYRPWAAAAAASGEQNRNGEAREHEPSRRRSVRPMLCGSRMTPSLQGERSARLSRGLVSPSGRRKLTLRPSALQKSPPSALWTKFRPQLWLIRDGREAPL